VDRGELYHEVALRGQDQDSIMAVLVKMSRNLRTTVTEVHDAALAVAASATRSRSRTSTCLDAPRTRPARWRKPHRRWKS
jgi:hypothetical protein